VKRFRREAEVMGRLQHRNICRIFEMNEHEGSHYIVMEFVDGLSLADILYSGVKSTDGKEDLSSIIKAARAARESSSDKPQAAPKEEKPGAHRQETMQLPVEQAVAIFLKVCSAVEFAHTHGVLHRDLKPGNILLRSDGEPLVADFGLAKLSSAEAESSLSLSGNVLGTVENMAPEQAASSKSVDARADVYSLGTILFQMVTGKRHFAATGTLLVDIQTLQTHETPRPRSINPQVDPDLELIILKCLRQNPADRYRGVAALLADIDRYLKGETISARPVTALEVFRKLIQRNRAASIVAASALALILMIVTGAVFSLARQLKISESHKERAVQALDEIKEKEKLYAQTLEGRKLAELSGQELKNLIVEKEMKAKAIALELEEKKTSLAVATANAETEKARRLDAEVMARDLSRKISELASATPMPEPSLPSKASQATPSKPFINPLAVQMEIEKIENGFREDFSNFNLPRFESTPAEALELLDKRIDETASVLLKAPQSVRGWMLMGFLHLAGLEFKAAERSFEKAMANSSALVAGGQRVDRQQPSYRPLHSGPVPFSPLSHAESAPSLRDFARDNSSRRPAFGKNATELAIPLRQIPHALSDTASNAIALFASNPQMSKNLPPPMGRKETNNEMALQLLLENDLTSASIVKSGFGPNELDVILEGNAKNLSSISNKTKSLTIRNAQKIDTQILLNFSKLTRLDLNGSDITDPPPLPRTTLKLSQLGLANTKIQSLKFAAGLTNLTRLDISNTAVTDLTPLANCKSLHTLEVGGCRLENLSVLKVLPSLRNLTISPEFLKNPQELAALKSIPIPSIRTPEEPPDQSAVEFFRKHLPVSQN
jgi:hypothetical protein